MKRSGYKYLSMVFSSIFLSLAPCPKLARHQSLHLQTRTENKWSKIAVIKSSPVSPVGIRILRFGTKSKEDYKIRILEKSCFLPLLSILCLFRSSKVKCSSRPPSLLYLSSGTALLFIWPIVWDDKSLWMTQQASGPSNCLINIWQWYTTTTSAVCVILIKSGASSDSIPTLWIYLIEIVLHPSHQTDPS